MKRERKRGIGVEEREDKREDRKKEKSEIVKEKTEEEKQIFKGGKGKRRTRKRE